MSAAAGKPAAPAASPILIRAERDLARAPNAAELSAFESLLRDSLGADGAVTVEQDALIWQSKRRRVAVSFARSAGQVFVRVEESLQRIASSVFGGIMGGLGGALSGAVVGIGIGLKWGGSVLLPLALGALIMAGAFLLARTLFFREARKRYAQINALADALARQSTIAPR